MKEQKKDEEIKDYYITAPKIIKCIDMEPNKVEIYDQLYNKYILPCVEMMDKKNEKGAYDKYINMINFLKTKYKIK